ncbi:MAG: phage baseplate protein [Bacteroidales bacterium]
MTVENATYINSLNKVYPRNRDLIKEGDDHIRLVKAVLQNTFPGIDGAVIASTEKLNQLDKTFTYEESTLTINNNLTLKKGVAVDLGGAVMKNAGLPADDDDLVTLKYLHGNTLWPIGSIYMTVDDRNPNVILGFGNWEKFAAGRMIVGSGTNTDTDNDARTVVNGAKSGRYGVKLTDKNVPAHSHDLGTLKVDDSGTHDHTVDLRVHNYAIVNGNTWTTPSGQIAGENSRFTTTEGAKTTAGSGTHTHKLSGSTAAYGSGEKFDIIPPYIACNIWKRIADTVVV